MLKIWSEMSKIRIFGTFFRQTVEDSVVEWARFPNVSSCNLFYWRNAKDAVL